MAAPLLALHLGHDKASVGLLVALFALTQVFLSLPAGRYADRHGFKQPQRFSVIAASLGIGAAAVWPIYPVMCVAALLCGGAVGASSIAMQRYVGRAARSPDELRRSFSLLSLAPAGANVIGPLLAGVLIDYSGYRAAFCALAALPLLAWLVARGVQDDGGSAATGGIQPTGSVKELLALPHMSRLMLMNVVITSCWDFHAFMVPVLGHERGISASAIGMILGSFAVAAVLVRLAIPVITRRAPEWLLITAAAATAGLALIGYPFTTSAFGMAALSALLGLALGAVQPMALTLLHYIAPSHRRGEAMAIRLMLSNSTGVVMPVLLGALGGMLGVSGLFWLMGSLAAAGSRFGVGLRHVRGD